MLTPLIENGEIVNVLDNHGSSSLIWKTPLRFGARRLDKKRPSFSKRIFLTSPGCDP